MLPLYEGTMKSGQKVWYIVTDTDDKGNADQLQGNRVKEVRDKRVKC